MGWCTEPINQSCLLNLKVKIIGHGVCLLHIFFDKNLDSAVQSCELLSLSLAANDSTTLTKPFCSRGLAVPQTVVLFIVDMAYLMYILLLFSQNI